MAEKNGDLGEATAAPRRGKRSARKEREAADPLAETEDVIRAAAENVADDVRSAAEQVLESQKQNLADMAHRFAAALRRSAEAFAEEGGGVVAQCADRAADQADQFSDRLNGQNWRQSLADVETVARRQPELFLAGAIAVGFAVVRLIGGTAPPGPTER